MTEPLPVFETIGLHVVFSAVENNVLSGRVHIEVAVFGANGAIAIHDFLAFEGSDLDLVLNGAAMTIGFVPDFFRGLFRCHDVCCTEPKSLWGSGL